MSNQEKKYYLDDEYRIGDDVYPIGKCMTGCVVRQKRFSNIIRSTGKAHPHDIVAIGFTREYFEQKLGEPYMIKIAESIDFEFKLHQ